MKLTPPTVIALGALSLLIPSIAGAADAGSILNTPQTEARIDALLSKMTLEEKVGQLNQLSSGSLTGPARAVQDGDTLIRTGMVGPIRFKRRRSKARGFTFRYYSASM
jgi:beta-glucosidase